MHILENFRSKTIMTALALTFAQCSKDRQQARSIISRDAMYVGAVDDPTDTGPRLAERVFPADRERENDQYTCVPFEGGLISDEHFIQPGQLYADISLTHRSEAQQWTNCSIQFSNLGQRSQNGPIITCVSVDQGHNRECHCNSNLGCLRTLCRTMGNVRCHSEQNTSTEVTISYPIARNENMSISLQTLNIDHNISSSLWPQWSNSTHIRSRDHRQPDVHDADLCHWLGQNIFLSRPRSGDFFSCDTSEDHSYIIFSIPLALPSSHQWI